MTDYGWGGEEEMAKVPEKVNVLAIPQRLREWMVEAFVALRHLMAGIEGTISVLRRAFGILRCRHCVFESSPAETGGKPKSEEDGVVLLRTAPRRRCHFGPRDFLPILGIFASSEKPDIFLRIRQECRKDDSAGGTDSGSAFLVSPIDGAR